jgi:hypothetical protein
MSKLNLILFFGIVSLINSLLVDIKDDFDLNIEYRLEKQETSWLKRGQLNFRTKDKDTYKSTASLIDFNITPQMKKEISKECKLHGNYILQLINPKNNTERYYTSVNACDLVSANYHDKFLINSFTPIENDKIISLRYLADEDFEDDFSEDDDEEIVTNKKNKKKNFTKIELNQVKKIEGPIFSEEDDGADEATKIKKEEKKPQSFLSRYWYIIAIMMVMMMMNGGGQEPQPGQGQQGQGQGQQAGGAGNTNPGN